MLLLSGLWFASGLLQVHAVSSEAYIYTSRNPGSTLSHREPISISSITARLLFAQRLGISQYHSLKDADEVSIELLNEFGCGGAEEQIFQDKDKERRLDKLLVFIENVQHPEGEYLIFWTRPMVEKVLTSLCQI